MPGVRPIQNGSLPVPHWISVIVVEAVDRDARPAQGAKSGSQRLFPAHATGTVIAVTTAT